MYFLSSGVKGLTDRAPLSGWYQEKLGLLDWIFRIWQNHRKQEQVPREHDLHCGRRRDSRAGKWRGRRREIWVEQRLCIGRHHPFSKEIQHWRGPVSQIRRQAQGACADGGPMVGSRPPQDARFLLHVQSRLRGALFRGERASNQPQNQD